MLCLMMVALRIRAFVDIWCNFDYGGDDADACLDRRTMPHDGEVDGCDTGVGQDSCAMP